MEKLVCKLNKKEYNIVKNNPHCIQYFCEIDRIIEDNLKEYKEGEITKENYYKYQKELKIKYKKSNINLELYNFKKNHSILKTTKDVKNLNYNLEYMERGQRPSTLTHLGQLKLFLANMQFLLYYAPKNKEVHVVYPGSGGRSRLNFLTELFPQIRLHLIDPIIKKQNMIDKSIYKNNKIVKIHKQIFTNKLLYKYKQNLQNKYILLISDIRKETKEEDIDDDNKLNMKWVKILKPNYAQLKWRIPRIEGKTEKYKYLDGTNYLQMYPSPSSTETRLVVNGKKLKYKEWNYKEEDNIMYIFNRLIRPAYYKCNVKHECMDHCHDCVAMINLLKEYKEKYPENKFSKNSLKDMVEIMLKNITNSRIRLCKDYNNILKNLH